MLGSGRNYYHLTYIDDLCAGFRLCGTVPAAAGRTYILGGVEVADPGRTGRGNGATSPVSAVRGSVCRCGPSGWRGPPAKRSVRRSASRRRCTGAA